MPFSSKTSLKFESRFSMSKNWICGIKTAWKPKIQIEPERPGP